MCMIQESLQAFLGCMMVKWKTWVEFSGFYSN
jgi:hypothetical protein